MTRSNEEFDYIVVGAGSAGAIVASRLAEDPSCRVLLLEAGGSDRSRFCTIPGMISIVHTIPQVKKKFDWGYYTVPQKHAANRRIPTVRGKVLGGSSSINGMLYVRGNRQNFDDWEAEGCKGWGYDDVLRSYKKNEDWEGGASSFRGAGGPVAVTRQKGLTPASEALVGAIAETCGAPVVEDYNAESQEGASVFQMSAKGGLRFSTSEAYLERRSGKPNLEVRTGVTVAKIVIAKGRATGVELLSNGERTVVGARREIVLSAGVIGSAQILMLSGVGPASELKAHGIEAIADLPVGRNLHDHLFVPMTFPSRHRAPLLWWHVPRGDQGRHLVRSHRLRGGWIRPIEQGAGEGPRSADPRPAVVVPLAESGSSRSTCRRYATCHDRDADAHLPEESR
jgi:choline dehydrogenase-like flavoprotein